MQVLTGPTRDSDSNAPSLDPNIFGQRDYEALTGVKEYIVATNNPWIDDGDECRGALIKDAETKVAQIVDGLSNTLMFVEKASAPDVYEGRGNLSPTGDTNQTIAALDSLGPAKLHGIDPTCNPKCKRKNDDGNVAFNATNDGEAYGFHPGILVVSSMDGATHTLSESIDVRSIWFNDYSWWRCLHVQYCWFCIRTKYRVVVFQRENRLVYGT